MKTKLLILVLSVLSLPLTAQEGIPVVNLEQGEIIGALPYGRHFYLRGSAALPSGEIADSVVVRIYETNVRHFVRNKKNSRDLTDDQKDFYTQKRTDNPYSVEKSVWVRYRDRDAENFQVYVNKPLRFAREYIVEVNYFRRYNFVFSDDEKTEILQRVTEITQDVFADEGLLTSEQTADYLNLVVLGAMRQKVEASGDSFYGFDKSLPSVLLDL